MSDNKLMVTILLVTNFAINHMHKLMLKCIFGTSDHSSNATEVQKEASFQHSSSFGH